MDEQQRGNGWPTVAREDRLAPQNRLRPHLSCAPETLPRHPAPRCDTRDPGATPMTISGPLASHQGPLCQIRAPRVPSGPLLSDWGPSRQIMAPGAPTGSRRDVGAPSAGSGPRCRTGPSGVLRELRLPMLHRRMDHRRGVDASSIGHENTSARAENR